MTLCDCTCASDAAEAIGAVGSSVTFYIQSMDGNAAAWSFHNDVIAAVEFGDPPKVTFFDDTYKPRWTFSKEGRGLTISQLRMDDAGTYTAKVMRVKTTFTLYVYRELAVPTVTCTAQNCSADGCRYTLHCTTSGSGSGNVSYGWSKGGQPWSEGPTLLVEESPPDEPPLPLTCTVRNPVGSRNATVVSPAALCAENTTHPPAAGTYSSSLAGIVAGSVVGAIVLLAVFFMIYWKSKGWRIFCLPAAEAMNAVSCWKTPCEPTKKQPGAQP
ncbi:SLAM family member 5-like [Pelecanus crispus]|uniref:SLAM family member 5-like n=1 Tax=Pelecanus crispus TaxID=36300 RepID=UPI003F5D49F2